MYLLYLVVEVVFQSYCTIVVFAVSLNIRYVVMLIPVWHFAGENWNSNDVAKNNLKRNGAFSEPNATMEVAQLLLSLLHAWGMDPDLDRVCEGKLGLLRPMVPVSFGVLSKGGML